VALTLRHALQHKGVGEALDTVRLGLERLSVRLARLRAALRAHHVLGAGQGQEIAELGGVDSHARADAEPAAVVEVRGEHALHAVVVDLRAHHLGARQDGEPSRLHERRCHGLEGTHGHARLEGETRDPAAARIRMRLGGQGGRETAIVVADGLAEGVVAARPAEALDVLMLVEGRDALGGELAADPVRLLEEAHAPARARRGQRRRHAARAAAHHQHVAAPLLHAAAWLADRAYLLESGHISLHGTAAELGRTDVVRKLYLGA